LQGKKKHQGGAGEVGRQTSNNGLSMNRPDRSCGFSDAVARIHNGFGMAVIQRNIFDRVDVVPCQQLRQAENCGTLSCSREKLHGNVGKCLR
jgi:hypothetical protein